MSLPLLERARQRDAHFLLTPKSRSTSSSLLHCGTSSSPARIPSRAPLPGEQFRFHFDMTKCIGCKCCIVACNEQNGNPAAINWRRVGEIEGGWYPNTQRFHLSMGCNHCLEPTCLKGCPVDAYSKDPTTGIVLHSADTCIGCQYCTWNCSYGVPQYNSDRGVVGKCDLCHNRLSNGREPACVSACPETAIQVEIVNIAEWRREYVASANAPGLPSAEDSLSSTRITLPAHLPPDTRKADFFRVGPERSHWPLVIMTVLTQLSVGAFATLWTLQLFGETARLRVAATMAFLVAGLALNASTLHLGRPAHAYRALKMWKRSWLSREVLLFGCFSGVASFYAALLWFRLSGGVPVGAFTTLIGVAGVTASACVYLVPARPAWNSKHTIADFLLTAMTLGPLLAVSAGVGERRWLLFIAAGAVAAQLLNQAVKFFWLTAADSFELQASSRLLATQLAWPFLGGSALLILAAMVPFLSSAWFAVWVSLALALAAEIVNRYVFFASVVPKNMAASYLTAGKAAA